MNLRKGLEATDSGFGETRGGGNRRWRGDGRCPVSVCVLNVPFSIERFWKLSFWLNLQISKSPVFPNPSIDRTGPGAVSDEAKGLHPLRFGWASEVKGTTTFLWRISRATASRQVNDSAFPQGVPPGFPSHPFSWDFLSYSINHPFWGISHSRRSPNSLSHSKVCPSTSSSPSSARLLCGLVATSSRKNGEKLQVPIHWNWWLPIIFRPTPLVGDSA